MMEYFWWKNWKIFFDNHKGCHHWRWSFTVGCANYFHHVKDDWPCQQISIPNDSHHSMNYEKLELEYQNHYHSSSTPTIFDWMRLFYFHIFSLIKKEAVVILKLWNKWKSCFDFENTACWTYPWLNLKDTKMKSFNQLNKNHSYCVIFFWMISQ